MNTIKSTEAWTIYNCHIHTFTKRHTPRQFIKWVLSDAELGKISARRVPVYIASGVLYLSVLKWLARRAIALSKRTNTVSLLLYSFVMFFQALLVLPAVVLTVIVLAVVVILEVQAAVNLLFRMRSETQSQRMEQRLLQWKQKADEGQKRMVRSSVLHNLLVKANPNSNDIFERMARFLKVAEQPTQRAVFKEVEEQYPEGTVFVVLPMDMSFMGMGTLHESIERQHTDLLTMARSSQGRIIPFYAADPRHPDIVERVRANLARDKFQGIKIYPNLGYRPDHERLLEIYKLCIEGDFPVITHCSPGGIWKYGLSRTERRENSKPLNYQGILDMPGYGNLKLCLAHFGGADEWVRHLKGRTDHGKQEEPWVRTIFDMIASGRYPNLYADISYTVFTPKVRGLYIDLVDYLKVMMNDRLVREHVLFGSDYYMVERESISEKEASILLRSRLGEDLYKQIAHTNPRKYLNIE